MRCKYAWKSLFSLLIGLRVIAYRFSVVKISFNDVRKQFKIKKKVIKNPKNFKTFFSSFEIIFELSEVKNPCTYVNSKVSARSQSISLFLKNNW